MSRRHCKSGCGKDAIGFSKSASLVTARAGRQVVAWAAVLFKEVRVAESLAMCSTRKGSNEKDTFEVVLRELQGRFGFGTIEGLDGPAQIYCTVLRTLREERSHGVVGSSSDGNIVIFDWDDTILATTALTGLALDARKRSRGSDVFAKQLAALDPLAVKLFETAESLGQVVIVTNASVGWVEESSEKFLPRLHEYLTQKSVPIISARDLYSTITPETPCQWKTTAIEDILNKLSCNRLNVTVLGDCFGDQYAAHAVQRTLGKTTDVTMKFVKLQTRPTIQNLVQELALLSNSFERILKCQSSFDICVG